MSNTIFCSVCLISLLSLAVGLPAKSKDSSTKLDYVENVEENNVTTVEATTTKITSTNSSQNNVKRSYESPSSQISVSSDSKPVYDSGDKTRPENDYVKPALKYFQNIIVDMLQPQPIVDTIREEDKYGNDGEKLGNVGRSIVGGVAKLTRIISSAVEIPYDVLKSFTRRATETLNSLGGKIVGIN